MEWIVLDQAYVSFVKHYIYKHHHEGYLCDNNSKGYRDILIVFIPTF